MAWLYSGFRKMGEDGRRTGWHDSPISYGAIGRVTIDIGEHPTMHASSVQLDAIGTAVWLSELPTAEFLSDSVTWFARVAELARRTVATGRIVPTIANEGPFTVGRWTAVTDEQIDDLLAQLDRSMPPICAAGSSANATTIYTQLVDGIARSFLHQSGWKVDLGRQRKPAVQAKRALFGALSKPDHVMRGTTDEYDTAVRHLRDDLDRHRRRVNGEPVVVPRLRLLIADDPHDPWVVRLELVDDADAARWCSANDLWERNGVAIDVARGEQHLDALHEVVADTVSRIVGIPGMADLAVQHEPTSVELDLEVAEDFIDIAPANSTGWVSNSSVPSG